ncbi:MAG: ATP-binding protein [Pseudomonadota bacterium]
MSDPRPTLKEIFLGKKASRDVLIPANFGTGGEQQTIDIAKGLVANAPMPGPFAGMINETAANQDFSHDTKDFGTLTWDSQRNEITLDAVLCQIAGIDSPMMGARLKDFLALVSDSTRDQLADGLRRSLQTGRDLECTCYLGTDPQTATEVRILGKTLPDAQGRPASVVCAVQPRVPLGRPKVRNDTPLAKTCHDLRTPLNAIRGYSQMMQKDPLTERQRECLTKVETQCHAMLSTIDSELGETSEATPEGTGFSAFELISDVAEMFNATGLPDSVSLSWKMQDNNCMVHTDRVKLRRILVNLVDNAIKHTQAGEILITGELGTDEQLSLSVTDTGCGIPAEVMPRVFEPFFRLEQVGGQVGAGLGLAICRDLTQQLEGSIEAESEPGQGSCFTVKVPVSVTENRRRRDTQGRTPSLLLVGDNSFHNRCISDTLAHQGQPVSRIENLSKASDNLDAQLVMLDCSDNPDAVSMVSEVRSRLPTSAIVTICDSLDGVSADQLLSAGADTLLIKPFMARELTATIDSALKQAQHRTPPREVRIPANVAKSLGEAAERADVDGLENLIGELETIDQALAGDLKEMTRKFDYDGLMDTVSGKRRD